MHYRFALLTLPILVAVLVAVPAVPASDGRPDRAAPVARASASCGTALRLRAYSIKTRSVNCRTAKKVVRQWNEKCSKHPRRRCVLPSGFRCRYSFDGYEAATVTCTRGTRRVTWKTR